MNSKFFIPSVLLTILIGVFCWKASMAAPQPREVTIENNCPMQVLWGITGSPIQTEGHTISCTTDAECKNWAGSTPGDQGICGENGICYFAYPEEKSSTKDSKPYYVLAPGQFRKYTITPIKRLDKNGNAVTQYTFNIGPQLGCSIGSEGTYQCQSGACGGRISGKFDGQCQPSKGQQPPFTQIEMTTNDGQNDFYDISIINGMNLPVKIDPVGTSGNQNKQRNFWCTSPGAAPTGDPNKLNGCSWAFSPPSSAPLKPEVFVQVEYDNQTSCSVDADCATGEKCGLKFPEDLKTYNSKKEKPAFCGTPLGYYTPTQICSLGGLSADLVDMFNCSGTKNITLTNLDGTTKKFSHRDFYQCATDGQFLDSCYNYQNKQFSSSTFCCGCIDWPGIPTDNTVRCGKEPQLREVATDFTVYPSAEWLSFVKPKLAWLIDGCPDAYEYQYGDKHGTIQCSTKDIATQSGNAMNYKITFCPQGKTLFPTTKLPTIVLSKPDATVISGQHAILHWTVTPFPDTADFHSTIKLQSVAGSTRTCTDKECHVSYTALSPDTTYQAVVTGQITSGGTTVPALPRYVRFTTDSSPPTQSVNIVNEDAHAVSGRTISATWDIDVTPPATVNSTASIRPIGLPVISTQTCNLLHCEVDFPNLTPNTTYQVTINASGGGEQAEPKFAFAKTKQEATGVTVPPPSKGDMRLTNVIGPGAYCSPSTLRFPYLSLCQSGTRSGFRCVNEIIDGQNIGEWVINQVPSCRVESDYDFSHLNQLTAIFHSADVSFTFHPNRGWQCAAKGSSLICRQA